MLTKKVSIDKNKDHSNLPLLSRRKFLGHFGTSLGVALFNGLTLPKESEAFPVNIETNKGAGSGEII